MSKNEHEYYQLDDDVVLDSVQHLMKLWKNGRDAFLNINCRGGKAWLSFSTCLGFQDRVTQASSVSKERKPKPSPSKIRRNQVRAQAYRERRRQEAEASRPLTPKSQSKEINASFSSSAAPVLPNATTATPAAPVSPEAAKSTAIPVSMDKPSFQISNGSIKTDESICEKTNKKQSNLLIK